MAAILALTPETSNASFGSNNTDDVYSLMNEAGIQLCDENQDDDDEIIAQPAKSNKSVIWDHFTQCPYFQYKAICNYCLTIVSDNAEAIQCTARILKLFWFGYYPDTLNLVVKDALKLPQCSALLTDVRNISSHFKRSCKASDRLRDIQKNMTMPQHRMKRDCETRWSSTYDMLERFTEQFAAVQMVCSEDDEFCCPTRSELQDLRKLRDILKPFKEVTTIMSSEKNVTASSIIYLSVQLLKVANQSEIAESHPEAFAFAEALKRLMIHGCFASRATNPMLRMCTILYPRYKTHTFPNAKTVEDARRELYDATAAVSQEQETEVSYDIKGSIFDDLDQSIAVKQAATNSTVGSRMEVDGYLAELPIGWLEDPIKWWYQHKGKYQRLYKLSPIYLGIIMNSVSCERIFSTFF